MSKEEKKVQLFDNHGRVINYVRLAVTDRCNLRCFYCMPEEGIKYVPKNHLLSYEEMERLMRLLAGMGINKIRITGGEPFVRKGMLGFMQRLSQIDGIEQLHITTNGTQTTNIVRDLKEMGISSVNLSLDTLNPERFFQITRRDVFPKVMDTFQALLRENIRTKINTVVMDGKNDMDILPMVELTKDHPVSVRFIEEMPFNGTGQRGQEIKWNFKSIIDHIKSAHPGLKKIADGPSSTSMNYEIPGWKGTIGVIAAFSRTFCGTCNRIRLTPEGLLKTCLYDDGVFNVRDLIRNGATSRKLNE